jgi:hypothetical protein
VFSTSLEYPASSGNLEEFYEASDAELSAWRTLVALWW